MNSEDKKKRIIFLVGIIFLFSFLRLSVLLTNIDQIFAYEERTNGCIAKDIISREVKMPLFDYQAYPHSGGTLVAGILTTPLFMFLGPSLISLKVLPFLFSLGTLLLWYFFLIKYADKEAAIIFSLLFTLSSPFYTKISLIAWGNHCESNFFAVLSIYIFFNIFFKEGKRSLKSVYLLILGLLSGFSLYFSYIYLITLITIFIFWMIFYKEKSFFLKRKFPLYLFGGILGFSPWIAYNLYQSKFKTLKLFSEIFIERIDYKYNMLHLIKKFYQILLQDIPKSHGFEMISWKGIDLSSYLYHLLFIISFLILFFHCAKWLIKWKRFTHDLSLREAKRRSNPPFYKEREWGNFGDCHSLRARNDNESNRLFQKPAQDVLIEFLPIAYIAIFLFIFTFSGFYNPKLTELEWFHVSKYRYYAPLYPVMFLTIALGLRIAWKKTDNILCKGLITLSLLFLIILGLFSNLEQIKFSHFGKGFVLKGYHYDELLPRYISLRGDNFKKINYLIGRIDKEYIPEYYELIGIDFGKIFKENIAEEVKVIEGIKPDYRHYLYSGIGRACISIFGDDFNRSIELIKKLPDDYRDFCYEGLSYEALIQFHKYSSLDKGWASEWDISKVLDLIKKVDERHKKACYLGLGRGIMAFEFYYAESRRHLFSDLVWKSSKAIKEIENQYKEYCYQGIGMEYGRKVLGYFFAQSYFQPEQGYGLENKFYSEALNREINRILKGDKTLAKENRENYYEGVRMAVLENFKDERVKNFITYRINEKKLIPD